MKTLWNKWGSSNLRPIFHALGKSRQPPLYLLINLKKFFKFSANFYSLRLGSSLVVNTTTLFAQPFGSRQDYVHLNQRVQFSLHQKQFFLSNRALGLLEKTKETLRKLPAQSKLPVVKCWAQLLFCSSQFRHFCHNKQIETGCQCSCHLCAALKQTTL